MHQIIRACESLNHNATSIGGAIWERVTCGRQQRRAESAKKHAQRDRALLVVGANVPRALKRLNLAEGSKRERQRHTSQPFHKERCPTRHGLDQSFPPTRTQRDRTDRDARQVPRAILLVHRPFGTLHQPRRCSTNRPDEHVE